VSLILHDGIFEWLKLSEANPKTVGKNVRSCHTQPVMSRELTEAPVQGLIRKMALPASIGFFFNTMYNVVDTYFGGQISTTALAANRNRQKMEATG
jgi:hypothetical protein